MSDSLQKFSGQQQPQPHSVSDMLVVRRAPNPDGSARPIFTIVRNPSSSATAAAQPAPVPSSSPDPPAAAEESEAAIYGESFWIDDFGCDPVMDVAPGAGRQASHSSSLAHLVIDGGVGNGSSAGRQSRLLRCCLGPDGQTAVVPLPKPTSPKLMSQSVGPRGDSLAVPPKMLQCSKCGKHFRNLYSLEHHICAPRRKQLSRQQVQQQEVNGIRYYLCPACGKPFKWIGNLTRHFHTHTGGRFFRCEICGKSFFTSYQVKRHMNSHLGVRYKCTVCAKPFTCKYSCTWHIRQHLLPQHEEQQQLQQPLIEQPSRKYAGAVSSPLNYDNDDVDMDDLEDADSIDDYNGDVSSRAGDHNNSSIAATNLSPVATVTVETYCPV